MKHVYGVIFCLFFAHGMRGMGEMPNHSERRLSTIVRSAGALVMGASLAMAGVSGLNGLSGPLVAHGNPDANRESSFTLFDQIKIRGLLALGANVNQADSRDGSTPLHRAVSRRGDLVPYPNGAICVSDLPKVQLSIVRSLIAAKADVNQRDHDGRTALHHALSECADRYLPGHNEWDSDSDDEDESESPRKTLDQWLKDGPPPRLPLIECLVDAGADVNAQDNKGRLPLEYVSDLLRYGNVHYVKYLIEKSANVHWYTDDNASFLLLCMFNQAWAYAFLPLASRYGGDINAVEYTYKKHTGSLLWQFMHMLNDDDEHCQIRWLDAQRIDFLLDGRGFDFWRLGTDNESPISLAYQAKRKTSYGAAQSKRMQCLQRIIQKAHEQEKLRIEAVADATEMASS